MFKIAPLLFIVCSGIEIMEKIRLRGTFSYIGIYW